MSLTDILSLQGTLFILMLVGAWLRKKGIISDEGKKCLTDLCILVVIPCNTFKSCLIELDGNILQTCGILLIAALTMEIVCLLINHFGYRSYPSERRKVLQYCTIVPMSGFLGNPIAEGLFDEIGVLYTSIFLIPMRIIIWSVGTSYFVADGVTDKKKVLKNVLTHPCLVAIYLGLVCMILQIKLPSVILSPVRYLGNCNSALTMLLVGTNLAEVNPKTIVSRDTLKFSVVRLILIPLIALFVGLGLRLEQIPLSISIIMSGMPAGATAAIFASRYHSDADFATRCVVMTTLASMVTLPVWCLIILR